MGAASMQTNPGCRPRSATQRLHNRNGDGYLGFENPLQLWRVWMASIAGVAPVDQVAAWRLGRWRRGEDAAALSPATAARLMSVALPYDLGGLAILDAATRRFAPINSFDRRIVFDADTGCYVQAAPWHHPVDRYLLFADFTHRHGLHGLFVLNLFDAQPWNYATLVGEAGPLPVFQISRLPSQDDVILWPAEPVYMGPDGKHCPAENHDTVSFADKQPRAVWRGRLSGAACIGNRLFWAQDVKREVLDRRLGLDDYLLSTLFQRFPRFGFVARYHARAFCDVAFAQEPGHHHYDDILAGDPQLAPWRRLYAGHLDRDRQLWFRYIVCLEGNDYATGLFWALNSNSVVMMPPPRWQTILHDGLQPWVHYIPLNEALDDLEAKIAWGNANTAECEAIAARAGAFMHQQNDPARRQALDLAVMRRYLGLAD
jgi:hypothetical protein